MNEQARLHMSDSLLEEGPLVWTCLLRVIISQRKKQLYYGSDIGWVTAWVCV